MNELVSIIIPIYNMEKSLEKCIKSILNQDYKNIEIILVDDGSKDNSFSVCQKLKEQYERIKCIHTENQGSGPARNVGITNAKGKYFYFPDADDYLDSKAVSILVNAMDTGKYDLVVFGYQFLTAQGKIIFEKTYQPFSNSGEKIRLDYSDYFGMKNQYSIQGAPWNKFFDGETIRKNKIDFPALKRHQDEAFISKYINYCKNVRFIPDVLYSYYPNTIGLEWKKYPIDYADCIIGLNNIWQETICAWNPTDKKVHALVKNEIFSKIIKCLELSFSPKLNLKFFSRIRWIKETCRKTKFSSYSLQNAKSIYQKIVLFLGKTHCYALLLGCLYVGNIRHRMRQG